MFGNLVNKNQLIELVRKDIISITPFSENLMQVVHYPLKPGNLSVIEMDGSSRQVHDFRKSKARFVIERDQYLIVEVAEFIKMTSEGIVGQFIAASRMVTLGLNLICGKISSPYGTEGERIIFGIKNVSGQPALLKATDVIAYIQFFDLRGLKNDQYRPTQEDLEEWLKRRKRVADDGVEYDRAEEQP